MFDIGWSELVIVGVVALLVIGPKELPGVLRMVGQWMGKVRRMAADFQGQFQEAMREAEMADLKKQVDDIADSTRDFTSDFDPMRSVEDAFDDAMDEKPKPEESKHAEAGASASTADTGTSTLPSPEPAAAEPPSVSSTESKPTTDAAIGETAPPAKAAAGGGAA